MYINHNHNRQLVTLKDAQVPQKTWDKSSLLLQNKFDSIVAKSSTDVGRTNLFKMDTPTTGPPIACRPYPNPFNTRSSSMKKCDYWKVQFAFQKA